MKILFNNFNNVLTSKTLKEQPISFGDNFKGFQSIPERDVFVSSRNSDGRAKYLDDQLLMTVPHYQTFLPEVIELARLNYVAANLLMTSSQNLKRLEKGETTLESIMELAYRQFSPKAVENFEKLRQKSGITTDEKLIELTKINDALLKKKFANCTKSREIIHLFGALNNPQDMLDYSEVLLEACFSNTALNSDFDYNEIVDFAKSMGAKNEDTLFNKTFAHLAPDFNDFKTADDKLQAIDYARMSYAIDKEVLKSVKQFNPELEDVDIDDFYSRNSSVVDYIFNKEQEKVFGRLFLAMQFDKFYEIAPYTINALSSMVDAKTPQGKVELYEFIVNEDISPTELAQLTKQSYYDDISCADVIINRLDTIKEMVEYYNIQPELAKICYLNLGHTINVAKNSDVDFYTDPLFILIFSSSNLDFRTDKEFSEFYLELTKGSGKPQKNKKGQQKISQKEVINFINLLSFLEPDLAHQYKQDKKFPLYAELKKRKLEFEKVQDKIEKLIDKYGARRYLKDAFYTYKQYYDYYSHAKNLETFVLDAIEIEKEHAKESSSLEEKFLYYFKDKEVLDTFLSKNKIKLDKDTPYTKQCDKLLDCLVKDKDEKTAQELCKKLANSEFLINSQKVLAKFIVSRSEKELQALLEIALSENIASAQELTLMIKPYLNKQKQIDKLLAHYKTQRNMDFGSYLSKINQIQKDLNNFGFSIVLNNDNIQALDLKELKNNKLNLNQALKIAKEILNQNNDGNFIAGMEEASVEKHTPYTAGQIAKELTSSQTGRYKENYSGFLDSFSLKVSDLGLKKPDSQYEKTLQEVIKKEMGDLISLLNSDIYMYEFENGKLPNLTLHARMRLIDRFILQEDKDLFDENSFDEIRKIMEIIYTQTPYKMEKAKNGFSVYFKYGENEEIKAVFTQKGEMLTIAKNKL